MTGPAARSLAPLPAAARVLRLPQVAAYMRMSYLFFSSSRSGFGVGSVNVTASADAQVNVVEATAKILSDHDRAERDRPDASLR